MEISRAQPNIIQSIQPTNKKDKMKNIQKIKLKRIRAFCTVAMLIGLNATAFGQWLSNAAIQTIWADFADPKVGIGTTNPTARIHAVGNGMPGFYATGAMDFAVPTNRVMQFGHWDGTTFFEKMRIRNDGKVGIGTDDPSKKLEISGSSQDGSSICLNNTGSPNNANQIEFRSQGVEMARVMSYTDDGSNGVLRFLTANNGISSDRMRIDSNGDVGIGTGNPGAKLEVAESSRKIAFHVAEIPFQEFPLAFQPNFRSSWIEFRHGNDAKGLIESHDDDGSLSFYAGNSLTRTMTITEGKVGIGTTTPDVKLTVVNGNFKVENGNIRALYGDVKAVNGNIRVIGGSFIDDGTTLNTPDYVFEPDYQLESIEEHSEFMWREKHLPAVKSAKAIRASKGYNMGERREQMLEELEKAHLYIKQLHDRLGALEEKFAMQQNTLKSH